MQKSRATRNFRRGTRANSINYLPKGRNASQQRQLQIWKNGLLVLGKRIVSLMKCKVFFFLLDSGASNHIIKENKWLMEYVKFNPPKRLTYANLNRSSYLEIVDRGNLSLETRVRLKFQCSI